MRLSRPTSAIFGLLFLGLLLAVGHAWLATRAMREKSTTGDELAHITDGYNFNHWHDFRMHPENGLLPQRWQTLPLLLMNLKYPQQAAEAWRKSDVWLMGYRFFYQSGNDHTAMLAAARGMNSLFGAATILVVFLWSYRLWGPAGAFVSAMVGTFCPTMLANSGVATSDMGMTLFFLLSIGAYWRHLHDGRWTTFGLSLLAVGLAAVAKHSSLLLIPMVGILASVRFFHSSPLQFGRRTFHSTAGRLVGLGLSLIAHAAAAVVTIWAFFDFRYSAFNPTLPPGDFTFPWTQMLSFGGVKAQLIELCREWHLLPEGYLYGLSFVLKHAEARGAFLDGEYSIYGWALFFPKAFLYKTPLSLLTAIAASVGVVATQLRRETRQEIGRQIYRVIPLVALFCIYWAISLTSHLNIGHRHLLPTYPVLYIFCGALGWAATHWSNKSAGRGPCATLAIGGLLAWHVAVAAIIYPHFLAYFSPLVGGPAQGYKHLVDSSLDWGQDLPGLQRWLQSNRRPNEPLYLSYFGTGEPDYYGIDAVRMVMIPDFDRASVWYWFRPGLYALSASTLQHVYAHDRGPWTAENERQYQELRQNDENFRALYAQPDAHSDLLKEIPRETWETAWKLYARLRFARLCHYLRARRPDAMIGYSILVYRLDQAELDAAVNGDLRQLSSAIGKAVADAAHPPTPNR